MAHEDYKEMLPALALSALDAEDARVLNQHLSECDECRRELAGWENTAAELALSAPAAEPSPQVRDRIMSAVRNERQTPPRQESSQSRVVEFPQSRRAILTSFGQVGAIAAAVLCLVLILWIIVLWQQNRSLKRRYEDLLSHVEWVTKENERSEEFVAILSTPGAKVTQLQGSGPASGATAKLAYDRSGRAMLMSEDLPPAPAGKEYQLWFIVGKYPHPGRTFTTDALGRGDVTDQIPQQAIDSAVFAVTLERAGGEVSPTGAIYLRSGL